MSFDRLPSEIFLQILQHLPFKERVRVARVNRQFNMVSEMSISQTKALCLTAPIFRRAKSKQMSKIFRLSAANLKELICEVPNDLQIRYHSTILKRLRLFLNFQHPRLESLKIALYHVDFVALLADYCPNLKHISLVELPAEWACDDRRSQEVVNTALAKWPALQTFELEFYNIMWDRPSWLENVGNFWKMSSLRTLIVGKECSFTDQMLEKISIAFKYLERLEIDGYASDRLTAQGVATLKNLKHLRQIKLHWRCWFPGTGDRCAKEFVNFEGLEIIELIYGGELDSSTVAALARQCPKLRRLQIPGISHVYTRSEAARFVRSLDGFSQENLAIRLTNAILVAAVWECEEVRSALTEIHKSTKNRRLSINVGSEIRCMPLINEWDEDPECQQDTETRKSFGRRLIKAIRNLPRKMFKIFKYAH